MPEITPFTNDNTQTITAKTILPSSQIARQQQQAPVEAPAVPPTPEAVKEVVAERTEEVDPRFIALSKKEKELQRQRRELEELKKQTESKYKPLEELMVLMQVDKVKAAEKMGLTYDEYTNAQLGMPSLTPEQIAEKKAQEIVEQRLQQHEQRIRAEQEKAIQTSMEQAMKEIAIQSKILAEKSTDYPLVKETNSYDTVSEFIKYVHDNGAEGLEGYEQPGRVMSVEEANKQLNDYYEEQIIGLVSKVPALKDKILNTNKEEPKMPQAQTPQVERPKMQTLTHKTTTAAAPPQAFKSFEEKLAYIKNKYA